MLKLIFNIVITLTLFISSFSLHARCNLHSFREQCKVATQIFVAKVLSIEKQPSDAANQEKQTVKILCLHTWK